MTFDSPKPTKLAGTSMSTERDRHNIIVLYKDSNNINYSWTIYSDISTPPLVGGKDPPVERQHPPDSVEF